MLRFDSPPARLRSVAQLEGISYLLLLFVAMPLKYLADRPLAVTVAGAIHGALFIWLFLLVVRGMRAPERRGRALPWAARIGVAAIVPFGTFAIDGRLREEEEEWRAGGAA